MSINARPLTGRYKKNGEAGGGWHFFLLVEGYNVHDRTITLSQEEFDQLGQPSEVKLIVMASTATEIELEPLPEGQKYVRDLVVGDKTPWYEVTEAPEIDDLTGTVRVGVKFATEAPLNHVHGLGDEIVPVIA